jgi:ElaB/YqjD/DUF883 family membrane-anchored ribosome-binding protein
MESRETSRNGRSTADNGSATLGKRVDHVSHTAEQAWSKTRDAISSVDVKGRVRRNPYGSMAAAVGIGYVLGGGIFTPLTARIVGVGLRLGMRLALLPLLKQELSELAEGFESDDVSDSIKARRASKATATTTTDENKGR